MAVLRLQKREKRRQQSIQRRRELVDLRLTMSKSNKRPQGIEDQARVDHTVVVKLAKVLYRCDSLLIVLEVVVLHGAKTVS